MGSFKVGHISLLNVQDLYLIKPYLMVGVNGLLGKFLTKTQLTKIWE